MNLSTSSGKRRPARITKPEVDIAHVHERIWSAIMDHSLPPETRLVESELCEIFGLGRTRLRQVLQRLAHERVVTPMRNRGTVKLMPQHLDHVVAELMLEDRSEGGVDLKTVFGGRP